MSERLTAAETAAWFKDKDNFLLLTHRRPDGDTLGSASALAQVLREQGKTAFLPENPEVTPRYSHYIEDYLAPADFNPDYIVAIDTASREMFLENAECYFDSISLCIDHHGSNTFYADFTCLDSGRASCGEVIFDIITSMQHKLNCLIATRLYVALSTDTGCFSFGNTTANTLYVASQLVNAGAPNKEINKILFRTKSHGRIAIEGQLTSGIEYWFDGKVAVASITKEMLEISKADEDDLDDISALPSSIEGVCIGITIRELTSPTDCKISVRTKPPYNAQKICSHFNGGGHPQAAGAMIKKTIPEIKELLKELLV